ncbi:MAG: hypothetical protein QOD96_2458, partial [Pseudonocardiales bacterium]|nr:hypothetical protein [Pseudonocardiales bacterium]
MSELVRESAVLGGLSASGTGRPLIPDADD